MYGKLRQSDFLPVGEDLDSEVLERGVLSETTDSEDEGREHCGLRSDPNFSVEDYDPAWALDDPDFMP